MKSRHKRIRKLIEMRQQALEERVAELGRARALAEKVAAELEQAKTALREALNHRQRTVSSPTTIEEWRQAEDWISHRALQLELSAERRARVEQIVVKAQDKVAEARSDLRRLELLEERIKRSEARKAERVDRRLHDEIAAQIAANRG